MKHTELDRVIAHIEKMVCAELGTNPEELFELRLDMGIQYLENKYLDKAEEWKRMPEYWNWFRRVWMIHDKQILNVLRVKGELDMKQYIKEQWSKLNKKEVNDTLQKAIKNGKSIYNKTTTNSS